MESSWIYGLNPCFNGIWSASKIKEEIEKLKNDDVLILVLMEYGLRGIFEMMSINSKISLNPCFNGIWSARVKSVKICM